MRLLWEDRAWNDYLRWQAQDKETLKKNKRAYQRYSAQYF